MVLAVEVSIRSMVYILKMENKCARNARKEYEMKCIFCGSEEIKSGDENHHHCMSCNSKWSMDDKGIATKSHCFAENNFSWWVRPDLLAEAARTMTPTMKMRHSAEFIRGNDSNRLQEMICGDSHCHQLQGLNDDGSLTRIKDENCVRYERTDVT